MVSSTAMGIGKNSCQCGKCVIMPTSRECISCCEVDRIVAKKEGENEIACIMDHAGFEPVCLNLLVLKQPTYF